MPVKLIHILFLFWFIPAIGSARQKVISLYNGPAPGSESWNWEEKENNSNLFNTKLVYNVTKPTLSIFLPDKSIANGTALIICPGGAFHVLSIESEGFEVARWLNAKGVAGFVLKYRLVHSLTDDPVKELLGKMNDFKKLDEENAPVVAMAIADGKAAMTYVREHAAEFAIDPKRIGLMGFSAGGTLTASVAFTYTGGERPDFVAPIYLYMGAVTKTSVPKDAPPMFIAAATDDQLGLASHSIGLYNDWIASQHSAELHVYAKGGHGFGMRKQNLPADSWIERFGDWLQMMGYLKPKK